MNILKLLWNVIVDENGGTLSITRVTANTLITAAATNNRATEIEAVINGHIDADNIEDDAVTAAKLYSDVVRADYGLSQHTTGALQVDPSDTTPCLEITDGGLRVKVDGTTITRSESGLVASVVSDHGALTGLADDDHTAYLDTTRHDVVARHPIAAGGTGQATAGAAFAALAAGKVYDSGWFAVNTSTVAYTKTHSLGTTKVIAKCYLGDQIDGSGWIVPGETQQRYSNLAEVFGCYPVEITTTTITIKTEGNGLCKLADKNGNNLQPASGYYRIIMLALE